MIISLIAAVARDWAIGRDNNLIWHLRDDLKLFKETTRGHTVVMGRKSYEAIGRPLPQRRNVVITRQTDMRIDGVELMHSLEEVLAAFEESGEEIFILGGGELYKQTIGMAHRLYISHVDASFPDADTHFPEFDPSEWVLLEEQKFEADDRNEFAFRFCCYERKS